MRYDRSLLGREVECSRGNIISLWSFNELADERINRLVVPVKHKQGYHLGVPLRTNDNRRRRTGTFCVHFELVRSWLQLRWPSAGFRPVLLRILIPLDSSRIITEIRIVWNQCRWHLSDGSSIWMGNSIHCQIEWVYWNRCLVMVKAGLLQRTKKHFHTIECRVGAILGNKEFVFLDWPLEDRRKGEQV